jgi:acetyltransferase
VDLAVAVVPREAVPGVLEDCGAVGTRHLVISTAGFSDAGGEGRTLERALLERARELGVRIMGPNSIGTVEVGSGLCTSLASIEPVPPGAASFLGQSGLFASCFPRWLSATGRQGARRLAALGNKGDVDEADILACFALDEGTRAVGLYLEGITDGLRLARSLRDIGRRKPLVVLRAGRTAPGARAAASHTGALANDDRVAEAAMRQAGAVPVASFRELFDQVKLFEQLDRPVGGALGVVSITGVGCVLAADEAARAGLTLPELSAKTIEGMREFVPRWAPLRNPVDMWSTIEAVGPTEAWRTLSRLVLLDRAVETLLLVFIAIPEAEIDVATVFGGLRALAPAKCVVGSIVGEEPAADRLRVSLEALGIPCLGEPVEAISCLGRAHAYWGWRERQRA